jgi:hypothetical protein
MTMNILINALLSTNKPVCEKVAATLMSLKDNESNYNLHLRNADLHYHEIKTIAEAIKTVDDKNGPALQSFNMRYNPKLSDEGVFILVKNLPLTVTEIGLVDCGVGDKGGAALMQWASKAPKLHWLCVEHNAFSNTIKNRLLQFGKESNGLLVVT